MQCLGFFFPGTGHTNRWILSWNQLPQLVSRKAGAEAKRDLGYAGRRSGDWDAFLPLLVISPFPYPWLCEGKSRSFNFPKSSVTYAILQKPSPHCYRTLQTIQVTFIDISNAHSSWHSHLAPQALMGTVCPEPFSVPKPAPPDLAESTGELLLW